MRRAKSRDAKSAGQQTGDFLLALTGVMALFALPFAAQAQNYTLTALGAGNPVAISDFGLVVGSSSIDGGQYATIWTNGTPSMLGNSAGVYYSSTNGVNSSGTAVGYEVGNGGVEAVAFTGSTPTPLPGSGSYGSIYATAINNAGTAVGILQGDDLVGAVWSSGCSTGVSACTVTELPGVGQPLGRGEYQSEAQGINSDGVVVGNSTLASGMTIATVWNGTTPTALGSVAGAIMTSGSTLNDAGTVLGYAIMPNLSTFSVEWNGSNVTVFPAQDSLAGINNAGTIVGSADGDAALWQNGKAVNLNTVVASQLPAGYILNGASAINNVGQILASAFDSKTDSRLSYVLTPASRSVGAPEIDPASAGGGLAILFSILAILRGRRRPASIELTRSA